MKIFRSKKNGKLYTLEKVSPARAPGSWYEATPYNHSIPAGHKNATSLRTKRTVNIRNFEIVSER